MSARPVERGERGRYVGHRSILEAVPRVAARDVGRALQDPRRCAYGLAWRPEDSFPASYGAPGLEGLRGVLEPRRDGFRLALPDGRAWSVRVVRHAPCRTGWALSFRCPACSRRTRFLYLWGGLKCRRCARLRYRSEGRFLWRIERKLSAACGAPVTLKESGWTARLRPERR